MLSPFIFHVQNPVFQDVLTHALVGHGHESSATKNKVCLVIVIKISHNHCSSSATT